MKPKLIALCGPIGSGKTTAAKLLYELGYMRLPLAGPLKEMLRAGLGLTLEHTDGDLKEQPCAALLGKTPRYAMRTLGTEWGRHFIGQNLWTEAWKLQAEIYPHVVVDDARFENEFQMVRDLGGVIIGVWRPGIYDGEFDHASECDWRRTETDAVISNDGSTEDLMYELARTVKRLSADEGVKSAADDSRGRVGLHRD